MERNEQPGQLRLEVQDMRPKAKADQTKPAMARPAKVRPARAKQLKGISDMADNIGQVRHEDVILIML